MRILVLSRSASRFAPCGLLALVLAGCQAPGRCREAPSCPIDLPASSARPQPPDSKITHVARAQHVDDEYSPAAEREGADQAPELISPKPLTLADLEQMALVANPALSRAQSLLEASRGNWLQVGLMPNPTVGYEGQQLGSNGLAEQDGIFVGQEIVRGGKLRLNREVAAQEIAKAEHQLSAIELRVLTDVRVAFHQVLIAQRQEKLTGELHHIAQENLKTAQALERGKQVGKIDTLQAQLELENVAIVRQNALNRSLAAWRVLAGVIGHPDLPAQSLDGDVEQDGQPYEWQSTLDRLLSSSPEIALAVAEIERTRWAAERARVEKVPNVTVQGMVNVRDEGIGGRPDGNISVGLPLPLWNRNQGAVIQTSQAARAAERALEQLELDLRNRLAAVFERYTNAHSQVHRYRDTILPAARQSQELSRLNYQAGEISYETLLISQRTFSQTNLNYLEALRELRAAEAAIEGLLLSGSLTSRE